MWCCKDRGGPVGGVLTLEEEGDGREMGQMGPISGRLPVDGGGRRSRRDGSKGFTGNTYTVFDLRMLG